MKRTFTSHTTLPPGRTTRISKVQQRINIHRFGIPDTKRMPMCFSGCPRGIVIEPFQASSKMDGVTLESFITWSAPSHHIPYLHPIRRPSWTCCSKVQQRINIHDMHIPDTKRMPMCFSGCPLGIVIEPFQASSKMDGVTLESFITWSTPSHHIPCFHPVEPPSLNMFVRSATTHQHSSHSHSWHETDASVLLRVSPWYCQRSISDLIENGWQWWSTPSFTLYAMLFHPVERPSWTCFSEVWPRIKIYHMYIPYAKWK